MSNALLSTDLPLENKRTGKVRDLYDLTLKDGSDGILIIATDRVSAFDVVLANGIPVKVWFSPKSPNSGLIFFRMM